MDSLILQFSQGAGCKSSADAIFPQASTMRQGALGAANSVGTPIRKMQALSVGLVHFVSKKTAKALAHSVLL